MSKEFLVETRCRHMNVLHWNGGKGHNRRNPMPTYCLECGAIRIPKEGWKDCEWGKRVKEISKKNKAMNRYFHLYPWALPENRGKQEKLGDV